MHDRRARMAEQRRKARQDLAEKRNIGKQMQQIPRIEFSESEFGALAGAVAGRKREEILRKINNAPGREYVATSTEKILKNNLKRMNIECVEGVPFGGGCNGLAVPGGIRIVVEDVKRGSVGDKTQAADLVDKSGGILFRLTREQAASRSTAMLIRDEVQRRYGKRR